MAQPIKKSVGKKPIKRKKQTTRAARVREMRKRMKGSQEFGTSKLEERFAKNFLDKLGLNYIYQYKMVSIGRYLDFMLTDYHVAIEIDGDYWHGNPKLYEEKDLNKTQKWSKKVDEMKNKWCSRNGVPLIRIWEKDINEHPENVLTFLKEKLGLLKEKKDRDDKFNKRH
jgi:very-short-patch-repair endonuclease